MDLGGAGGLPVRKSHDFERRGQREAWFLSLVVCFGWLKVLRQCKVFSCAWVQDGNRVFGLFCAIWSDRGKLMAGDGFCLAEKTRDGSGSAEAFGSTSLQKLGPFN